MKELLMFICSISFNQFLTHLKSKSRFVLTSLINIYMYTTSYLQVNFKFTNQFTYKLSY